MRRRCWFALVTVALFCLATAVPCFPEDATAVDPQAAVRASDDAAAAPNVVRKWGKFYNSPDDSYDRPRAIAVDSSGNAHVTGVSNRTSTREDWKTIKYSPTGTVLWSKSYNGPVDLNDGAQKIALDGAGNVFVTGTSWGSTMTNDCVTFKFAPDGTRLWIKRYDGPGASTDVPLAMGVNSSGAVAIGGWSKPYGGSIDFLVIKYNSAGVRQWVRHYAGTGDDMDSVRAIAIMEGGAVIVTGDSVGAGTAADYVTIKYNASGVRQWVRRYNGPADSNDDPTALAVDGAGNIYVTGSSNGVGSSTDYATVKYNSSGTRKWVRRYSGPGARADTATAIAVDGEGNVYVTGQSRNAAGNYDYVTIKYGSNGAELWNSSYKGPAGGNDKATALALDVYGNVYVTGASEGSGGYDFATVKYTPAGVEAWVARFNAAAGLDDEAVGIGLDASANVYVTGSSQKTATDFGYATVKYEQE